MKKSAVLFVFLVSCLAFYVNAQSFRLKSPEDNSVVNDCPVFQWSSISGNDEYVLHILLNDAPYRNFSAKQTSFYAINPLKPSDFLEIGSYKWYVTKGVNTTETRRFSVVYLSCLPPYVPSKIDNKYGQGYSQRSFKADGTLYDPDDPVWNPLDDDTYKNFNGTAWVEYIVKGPEGTKINSIKRRETSAGNDTEAVRSWMKLKVDVSEGDNIFAFKYIFFTNGTSQINIEIIDESDNVLDYLGCIGGNTNSGCVEKGEPNTNRVSSGMLNGIWSNISYTFEPKKPGRDYYVRLTYLRGPRTEADPAPAEGNANFMMYFSWFIYGQCSTFDDASYTETMNLPCTKCRAANLYYPNVNYTGHCQRCEDIDTGRDDCMSIDYCVHCHSHHEVCENRFDSKCKAEAKCNEYSNKDTCEGNLDCVWCKINETCVYMDDADTCAACSTLDKNSCSVKSDFCHWCGTDHVCKDLLDDCRPCSEISKGFCTKNSTEGVCEYCNSRKSCIPVNDECNSSCVLATSKDECGGSDCIWCNSLFQCQELRYTCDDCASYKSVATCVDSQHPGCNWCTIGFCSENITECPVCDDLEKEECSLYHGINVNCSFCNSTLKCTDTSKTCSLCSSLSESNCKKNERLQLLQK